MSLANDEISHTILKGSYTGRYYTTCSIQRRIRSSPGIWLPFRQQHNIQEAKLLNKEQHTNWEINVYSCNKNKFNDLNRSKELYSNLYNDLTAVATVHTGKSTD
jgi:hypothetical protein